MHSTDEKMRTHSPAENEKSRNHLHATDDETGNICLLKMIKRGNIRQQTSTIWLVKAWKWENICLPTRIKMRNHCLVKAKKWGNICLPHKGKKMRKHLPAKEDKMRNQLPVNEDDMIICLVKARKWGNICMLTRIKRETSGLVKARKL